MKYKLVPTEYGVSLGKQEIIVDTLRAALFASKVVSPDCYTIEEI
jgi:hypothetical protein